MTLNNHKKQRGGVPLTAAEVDRIFTLLIEGKTVRAIEQITGHHRNTIKKYLTTHISGHPLTPLDDRVREMRQRILKVKEFDIRTSLLGDLVILDEYRDRMIQNIIAGRYPAVCDAQELKRIIDAKATIVRLPSEVDKKQDDIYDQIRERMARAAECGMAITATDFQEIGDKATDTFLKEEASEEGAKAEEAAQK